MSKKKTNHLRRKRYNRDQRLNDAKTKWLPTATAKNIAKSYSNWYGVDILCAIKELEILGASFSDHYKEQVKLSLIHQNEQRKRKEEKEAQDDYPFDYDDQFSFIAGYTANGVPYGVRWDEE